MKLTMQTNLEKFDQFTTRYFVTYIPLEIKYYSTCLVYKTRGQKKNK